MDKWIIEKIKSEDINYFDYKEFSDNVEIGRGGFGIVYKANWNKRGMKDAALKSMLNNNNNSPLNKEKFEEFIKELRLIRSLHYHDNINRFRGVTQDLSGNYMMVLQYANEGTLRDYLGNKERFDSLSWERKIQMALDITKGLQCLHDKQIIHRDLHSKNILVNDGKLMIADLGLSKQLTVQSNSEANGVIGMTEYIDPWCFKNNHNSRDKRSDIYSLGILLWEITSGHPPYKEIAENFILYKVSKGYREKPIKNTPSDYKKLYKKCWKDNPNRRPKINEVYSILNGLSSNHDSINNGNVGNETNNNPDETKNSRKSFISSSLIINVINVNWKFIKEKSNKPGEMELNELVNEIVQGYLRKNNNGTTKTFDFEHILRKFESQSTCLFNHLKNNPSKIHYEVVIGIFYKRGFGVEKSEKESFDQFKNASQKGDINSHYELGECFYNGTGTKKDFDKAFEYYKFAADKGLNIALFTLAKYYYNSNEYAKSIDYYEKSANKDFVPSQYYVAKFYNNGYGKKISIKKGLKWLEKYREKDGSWNITDEIKKLEARKPLDIAEAINEIVEDYKKNNHTGATKNFDFKYTLEKYEPRSKDIFNQLRDNQTLIQHYEVVIGTFYKKGFGVDKDEKESFEWFSKASQKNDINGHFELGECYYNGIGIGKDCKKALYYYTLAANKGLNIALCNLAEYFMNSKNKRKAFSYYKKAAKSGFVQSQYYLARCYNNKKRNIKKSLSWLKKYQENDGSWEISDEITKVEKQLVDQKEGNSLALL
ncbi:unnamed protein product [Rhizophagus irregularis]|nr:unnamed protein product [Rhizophagus irregularis]